VLSHTGRACHHDLGPTGQHPQRRDAADTSPSVVLTTWLHETAAGDDRQPRLLRCADGTILRLPVARWSGGVDDVDRALLDRARGPVLDVGCGPGRLCAELHRQGTTVLGVELLDAVPVRARAAGAPLLIGDLFGPLPTPGSWRSILLADGNIGIGGDPVRLLRRLRAVLAPHGELLVELHPRELPAGPVRLEGLGVTSAWFDWSLVSLATLPPVASTAGLTIRDTWEDDGRAFATLVAASPPHPTAVPTLPTVSTRPEEYRTP